MEGMSVGVLQANEYFKGGCYIIGCSYLMNTYTYLITCEAAEAIW